MPDDNDPRYEILRSEDRAVYRIGRKNLDRKFDPGDLEWMRIKDFLSKISDKLELKGTEIYGNIIGGSGEVKVYHKMGSTIVLEEAARNFYPLRGMEDRKPDATNINEILITVMPNNSEIEARIIESIQTANSTHEEREQREKILMKPILERIAKEEGKIRAGMRPAKDKI